MTLIGAPPAAGSSSLGIATAGSLPPAAVLGTLGVTADAGLTAADVVRRRAQWGRPNVVSSHRARLLPVLWHQLRSPLLALLLVAAIASYFVGERSDAVIIAVIVALSVGLGFVNEYRAEKAAEALHDQIHHQSTVLRDRQPTSADVTDLVPGDILQPRPGDIVPADIRLLDVSGLECDESVLTGVALKAWRDRVRPGEVGLPVVDVGVRPACASLAGLDVDQLTDQICVMSWCRSPAPACLASASPSIGVLTVTGFRAG